jgi:NADH-quinone oxidoreductase subunit M
MQFPFLSVLALLPVAAGVILLLLPQSKRNLIRGIALAVASVTLTISGVLFFSYDKIAAGYQFVERIEWLPALGISYHLGVDGFSVPLELMAGIVVFCGVVVSWKVEDRPREFFAFLLFLAASVFGVFASLDLFLLFFFFELAVFPKYLMIVMWGSPKTKEYGGMKLTLYLFIGSVVALVGVLAVYFASGLYTFDQLALEQAGFALNFQKLWFPFIFIGAGRACGSSDSHLHAVGRC